jgi:hypothetical protein
VQAAVAHRLGEKYDFTRAAVPGIRAALGLDDAEVRHAYERLYREPLETIYVDRAGLGDRVRWAWSALANRLEDLPPFWTAYSLTLTETVGATVLALPIAVAAIGPLPGVAILVVLGLVTSSRSRCWPRRSHAAGRCATGARSSGASWTTTSVAAARSS